MSGNENYKGVWGNMKFPGYTFQEFPKWVTNHAGESVIVNTQREELAIISMVPAGAVDPVTEEKNRLVILLDDQAKAANEKDRLHQAELETMRVQLAESNKLMIEMGNALKAMQGQAGAVVPEPAKPVEQGKTEIVPPAPAPKVVEVTGLAALGLKAS